MRGSKLDDLKPSFATMAATLRAQIAEHVSKHAASYKGFFAVNTGSNETKDDGPVPQDWDAFVASLTRPRRWIRGLSLRAAATRLGVRLIVVREIALVNGAILLFWESATKGKPCGAWFS